MQPPLAKALGELRSGLAPSGGGNWQRIWMDFDAVSKFWLSCAAAFFFCYQRTAGNMRHPHCCRPAEKGSVTFPHHRRFISEWAPSRFPGVTFV